jgi:hypothetical protein
MSSATTAAPAERTRSMSVATRSRRHGHWPTVDRLRSSMSTMVIRSEGGDVPAARSIAS